jgi:protein-disulfide isomerase
MKRNIFARSIVLFVSLFGFVDFTNENGFLAAKTPSGPALWIESKTIELGTIPSEQDTIVGMIPIINDGDEPLEILKVSGPCACFEGWSGDKVVLPGEGGMITVKFDKNKIYSGAVKRLVALKTNDPKNELARVYFTFEIARSDSEEIRMLRTELSSAKKELLLLRADMKKVLNALVVLSKGAPGCACAGGRGAGCAGCGGGAAATGCAGCGGAAGPSKAKARSADKKVYNVNIGSSPVLGKADAPVTITEWADFQCPYSAREYPKLKEILAAYPDKVRLVFKHRPLSFHRQAKPAHATAQLAMEQGGSDLFWKMHDRIIVNLKALEIKDLRAHAEALKLDLARFDEVMADPKLIDQFLKLDLDEAAKCKVNATPTVMINGLKLSDRSIETYKTRIEELLY